MDVLHKSMLKQMAVLIVVVLSVPLSPTVSRGDDRPLNVQVFELAQQCLNGENLSAQQLQQTITHIDSLNSTVKLSEHPQKKLFLIRLKKSRNMCLYLAQLQQKEE